MAVGLYQDDDPIYKTSQQARADLPVYGGGAPPDAGGLQPGFDEVSMPPAAPPPPPTSAREAELVAQGFMGVTAAPSAPANAVPSKSPRDLELESQGFMPVSIAPPPSDKSSFRRGLETSYEQLKQTGAGTVALVGDTFGLQGLKDWGLDKYQSLDTKVKDLSSENDDVFKALSKDGSFTDWLGYAAGYTLGQAGQMVATGGVGGLIGKALLQKGVQKVAAGMIERKVAELTTEQLIAGGMAEEAAGTKAAQMMAENAIPDAVKDKAVGYVSQMTGAAIAATAMNASQELGSIYGDAVDQAQQSGVPLNLAKVWIGGFGAAGLDTFTDMGALGRALHGAGHGSNIVGRVAKAGTAQALKEAATEGIQTMMERWGAQQSLTDVDALHDVINSAAMGAVGGAGAGAVAGVTGRSKAAQKLREEGAPSQPVDTTQLPQEDIGDVTPGSRGLQPPSRGLPAPGEITPGRAGLVPTTPTEAPAPDYEAQNAARWDARTDADRQRALYGHLPDADASAVSAADRAVAQIADAAKVSDVPSVRAGITELVGNAENALKSIGARPDIYNTLGQAQAALDALAEKHGPKARGLKPNTVPTLPDKTPTATAAATAGIPATPAVAAAPTATATAPLATQTTPAVAQPAAAPVIEPTATEPQTDLQAQFAAMMDPNNPKDSVFIAKGTPLPTAFPEGVARVTKPEGVYVTTDLAKARTIAGPTPLTDQQRAAFLGLPEGKDAVAAKSAAKNEPPVVVSAKDAEGNVAAQAATTADGPNVAAVAAQTPAGGTVDIKSVPDALQERAGKVATEQKAALVAPAPAEAPGATKAKATSKRMAAQKEQADAVQKQGAAGVLQPAPAGTGEAGSERGRVEQGQQGQGTAAKDTGKKPAGQAAQVVPTITIRGEDANGQPSSLHVWTEGNKIVRAEQHYEDGGTVPIATKRSDTLVNIMRRVEDDFTPEGQQKGTTDVESEGQGEGKGETEGTQPAAEAAGKQRTRDEALTALRRKVKQVAKRTTARAISEDAPRTEREAFVNQHLAGDWGTDHAVTLVDTPEKWQSLATRLGDLLGQKIQFFSPATAEISRSVDGFKIPGDPDTVYVNINHQKPALFIMGHEIGHNIQEMRPKLWNAFVQELKGLTDRKEFQSYLHNLKAQMDREAAARGESRQTLSEVGATTQHEVSADAVGTAFMDKNFWDLLYKSVSDEKKPLVQRVMEEFAALLKRMMQAVFPGTGKDAAQNALFKDVRALHRAVRDLIVDFRDAGPEELSSKELQDEAGRYYEQKMEPDEAEGHYPWAKLSKEGRDYWTEMYDLHRSGDIDTGELLQEFTNVNTQERRNRISEAQSGTAERTKERDAAGTLWDEKLAGKNDPDFDDLSADHKNYFIREVYDSERGGKGSPTAAYDQIMAWRAESEKGVSAEQKRTDKLAREQAKVKAKAEAEEEKRAAAVAKEGERKAAVAALVEKEMPAITERMGNLSPREQEIVARHFNQPTFSDKVAHRLSKLVADVLVDPKNLVRAIPDKIRPVIRRIIGGVKYSRAALGMTAVQEVAALRAATREATLDRVEPRITRAGKIVGAPTGKNTVADRARLVQKLTRLMGHDYSVYDKSKLWYEDSGRDIARLTSGNKALQEALIRLTAYYSQGVQVGANTTFTIRAIMQKLAGADIHSGIYPNVQSPRAEAILRAKDMNTSLDGVDNKLMNFYRNLKDATTGEDHYDNASTLDRWMMRVFGYRYDADEEVGGSKVLQTPQYEYGKDVMHRVAEAWEKKTGEKLKQRQVQAVLWTYIKNKDTYDDLVTSRDTAKQAARIYDALATRRGMPPEQAKFFGDFAADMEKKHALLTKQVDEFQPTSLNYADYFDKAQARVLYEVRPSETLGIWPFTQKMSSNDMREFSDVVRSTLIDPASGRDALMEKAGLPLHSMSNGSTGSWDGTISPNFVSYAIQDKTLGNTKAEDAGTYDPKAVNVYADALGYLLRQDAVFWFRPDEKGKNVGMRVTAPEMPHGFENRLYEAIAKKTKGIEFTRDGNEVVFVNTLGVQNKAFVDTIRTAVDTVANDEKVQGVATTPFKTDANFHDNDWRQNPQGEGYAQRLRAAGRSDLLPWLDGKRRQIDAIAASYAERQPRDAGRVVYSRKDALNPVEVYAMKDDKIVGMATYNIPNQSWMVFKGIAGGDIRDDYSEHGAATTEDALNQLRGNGVRLVRRKESPLMQGQHDAWTRGPDALFDIDSTPVAANNRFTKAADAVLTKLGLPGVGPQARRNLVRTFQDQYIDARSIQDDIVRKGGHIDASNNLYQKLTLYPGITGAKMDEFNRLYAQPMEAQIEAAMKKGATLKDIEAYLTAQHAPERNAMIAQRTNGAKQDGSGISTAEAQSRVRAYNASPYATELKAIGKIADNISTYKVDLMEKSGLIDADTATGLRTYEHYRPMKGLDEDDTLHLTGGMGIGSGFSGKASLLKYALGRDKEATNVVSNLLLDAEAKIIRAGKNEVGLSLAKLAEDHPDPKFWTVNPMKVRQVFDPETGSIRYQTDSDFNNPNIVTAYQNGQRIRIELKDTGFAQAINGSGAAGSNALLNGLRYYNRMMAMMMTSLNPEWGLVNAARDAQTAFFNIQSDSKLPPGTSKKVMAELLALGGHKDIYKAITDPANPTGLGRWYKELEAQGGITKFFALETLKDRADKLKAMEDRIARQGIKGKVGSYLKGSYADKAVQWLGDVNESIEAAPRVITYKALVEAGWSKNDAADYAKNLTVNFNRKGASNALSATYLFFNPALQGTQRLWQALQTPQGKMVASSLFAMGFICGLTGNAGGDDDKNGIPDYQQLSEWDRSTNIVPFTHGPKIPLPYGWNAFYAMGNFLADAFFGRSPMASAWSGMKAATNAFNPIGGADSKTAWGWAVKQVAPTILQPALGLAMNEDRFGGQIARTQDTRFGPKQPVSQMGKMGTTSISKGIASGLNALTGGSAATSGGIDINPDNIDFLAGSLAPGIPTSVARTASTGVKVATGEPTETKDWPVARRVVSDTNKGRVFEELSNAKQEIGEYLNIQKNGDPADRAALAKEHPGWAGVAASFTVYGKQAGDLEKRKAGIIDGKIKVADESAEKTRIDNRVMELNNRMLLAYNTAKARW